MGDGAEVHLGETGADLALEGVADEVGEAAALFVPVDLFFGGDIPVGHELALNVHKPGFGQGGLEGLELAVGDGIREAGDADAAGLGVQLAEDLGNGAGGAEVVAAHILRAGEGAGALDVVIEMKEEDVAPGPPAPPPDEPGGVGRRVVGEPAHERAAARAAVDDEGGEVFALDDLFGNRVAPGPFVLAELRISKFVAFDHGVFPPMASLRV